MKKGVSLTIVLGLIGIIFILLVLYAGKTFTGNVVKDTCTSPYIYIGGNCCLDKDNNQVCDEDEGPTSIIRAVEAEEDCSIDRKLTCAGKRISNNKITIKLRNDQSGIFSPTLIEITNAGKTGCKKTFQGKVEDGFDYQKDKEYEIDCAIDENYVDSLITIKGFTYEKSQVKGPAIMPYTIWDFETDGHISGMVQ